MIHIIYFVLSLGLRLEGWNAAGVGLLLGRMIPGQLTSALWGACFGGACSDAMSGWWCGMGVRGGHECGWRSLEDSKYRCTDK